MFLPWYIEWASNPSDARPESLTACSMADTLKYYRIGIKLYQGLFKKKCFLMWLQVFLTEYAGPLAIYLLFYPRPAFIYGSAGSSAPRNGVVSIACACWTFHYAKRLFETLFVHRFSNATMPLRNIFKVSYSNSTQQTYSNHDATSCWTFSLEFYDLLLFCRIRAITGDLPLSLRTL